MTGASTNMESSSIPAWNTPVSLVSQPALIATLVRAMAAVAGTPPNSGMMMLPTPCATSSLSPLIRSCFILPADAPHSSDSIIARAAMENAGTKKSQNRLILNPLRDSRSSRKSVLGISPTTATSRPAK